MRKRQERMQQIGKGVWDWISRIVFLVLHLVYKVTGKQLTEETVSAFLQFVKFGIVGVSNTIISYLIYAVSLLAFRKYGMFTGTYYLVAQFVGFMLSVLWSFYWNNKAVFVLEEGKQRSVWKALLKTYVSYSFTGIFLNTLLIYLWVDLMHISEFLAPMFNLVINVPINFLINKCWAFKVK